jgi:DNA invertase Pin-like site-specific DNA recombinase
MIAAIYARKSTEQVGVADEQKSVARQIEHARTFAFSQGWIVDEQFCFVDDGISGAEFENRPGLVRLLRALDANRRVAPFQVLIVSDLDRLGREQLATGYVLKQIVSAGVRVFSYLERKEIALDSPIATFIMQAQAFGATLEREKARQRTTDAVHQKARAGYVTGGAVYGYDNVEISTDGKRSHVVRRINETQASGGGRLSWPRRGTGLPALPRL